MDFLRDSIWTFIGVLIALIALILTVIQWMQRNRKQIAYEVISNTLVIPELEQINPHTKGILHVLFNGQPVKGARLVDLRIWNAGNVPITPADYVKPITFNFGDKAEILNVGIIETSKSISKPNAEDALIIAGNKVLLKSILLNRHASIRLKVLLLGFDGKITTDDTGIVGVEQLVEAHTAERSSKRLRIALMATTFTVFIFLTLSLLLGWTQLRFIQSNAILTLSMSFSMIALTLVLVLVILGMWLQNRIVFNSSSIE